MRFRTASLVVFLALVCCTTGGEDCLAQDPAPRQSLQEKRAIRKALGQYRRARRDLEAKGAAIVQAGVAGPAAVEAIQELVEQDLDPLMDRYRQEFLKAAKVAAAEKYQAANLQEVARLQEQVLALQKDPELSKEKIVQIADPAMRQLEELMVLSPEAVLANHRGLVEQREKMQGIGLLWQKCQEYLAEGRPPGDRPAENDQGEAREANRSTAAATTFEQLLQQEEVLVVRMAMPLTDTTRQVLEFNATIEHQLDPEEARCLSALNMTRVLLGLEALRLDMGLVEAARGHSADMVEHAFFSHESPVAGKRSFTDRAKLAGTTASGENIAVGSRRGFDTNQQWFHSPGHHRNMLGKHVRVGIGRAGKHWTELFGR